MSHTIGNAQGSGISGHIDEVREFVDWLRLNGHVVVTTEGHRPPTNHHIIGVGVGHGDVKFCESRGFESMAVYYENGDAFRGLRWWEDTESPFSTGVKYYGCEDLSRFGLCGRRTWASEALHRRASEALHRRAS